jgi:AraC-like DNA-binding protein
MAERIRLSTRDQAEAVPLLERFFSGVRMTNSRGEFSFDLAASDSVGLTQVDFRLISPQSASSIVTDDDIVVGQVPQGRLSLVDQSRREIDTSLPWIYPRGRVEGRWDEIGMRVLFLPKDELRKFVAAAVGDERKRFAFTGSSPSPERARTWSSLVAVTVAELQSTDPIAQSPLSQSTRMTHLMMGLVSTFPNTLTESDARREESGIMPTAVSRAILFMEDNAQSPITVLEIADAARLSTRGLQHAFRVVLHTTPMAQLRAIRLERVHLELVVADPSRGATVGGIATAWGFAHLGRFAQQYREVYGLSPSRTLEAG